VQQWIEIPGAPRAARLAERDPVGRDGPVDLRLPGDAGERPRISHRVRFRLSLRPHVRSFLLQPVRGASPVPRGGAAGSPPPGRRLHRIPAPAAGISAHADMSAAVRRTCQAREAAIFSPPRIVTLARRGAYANPAP